jgi:hypothetical protein
VLKSVSDSELGFDAGFGEEFEAGLQQFPLPFSRSYLASVLQQLPSLGEAATVLC